MALSYVPVVLLLLAFGTRGIAAERELLASELIDVVLLAALLVRDDDDVVFESKRLKTLGAFFVRVEDDTKPVFWASTARLTKTEGGKDRVYFVPCIDSANKI